MTYTVIWRLSATQQLAEVVTKAEDSALVRAAAARIDYMLRRLAPDVGESRAPGFRLWFETVLGVFYRIDEDAMRVEVLFCGPSRRH